ncbi:MAG: hypothetical protein JO149_02730, partial [Gammaproteobacteria bacterium]|nr:hypothetical protein [Gammaproteobacteria bacterium]
MLRELLFPRIKLADVSILRGRVSNLKYMTHVSGGKESVNTSYVATFEIDSKSIILSCSEPVLIDMDDEVAIAGYISKGIFKSTAYYNFRKKVYNASRVSCLLFYIFALVFLGLTTTLLISFYDSFLAILISGFLALVGYRFYHAGRIVFETSNIL